MSAEATQSGSGSFDARAFRHALGRFATGVTVITALDEGRPHGMTANAFVAVSLTPPLILVSLDNRSNMHRIFSGCRHIRRERPGRTPGIVEQPLRGTSAAGFAG
jgi:flavin reductase (DIM6/NTAB) family NADH-FMN oxidoreductase RutF